MPAHLRPEIIAAPSTYLGRGLAVGAAGVVVGIAMWLATPAPVVPHPIAVTSNEPMVPVELPLELPVHVVMETVPPPLPVTPDQIRLVFTAGGESYVKLASLGDEPGAEPIPRHGKVTLAEGEDDDYVYSAIAAVRARDVRPAHRAWAGRRVTVAGGCTATVTGFAVVARLTGDPVFVMDQEDPAWDASTVMANGAAVLAARLDGCSGGYGHDAALAPVVVPERIDAPALAQAATQRLLASPESAQAQRAWREGDMQGTWYESDLAETLTQVVRHPITGDTWVAVHVRTGDDCGTPSLRVWGLYRAEPDGGLTRIDSSLGNLSTVEQLIDLEGDGTLEVIGRTWLDTEREIVGSAGTSIQRLQLPFFGCPC